MSSAGRGLPPPADRRGRETAPVVIIMLAHGPPAHKRRKGTDSSAFQLHQSDDFVPMRIRVGSLRPCWVGGPGTLAVQSRPTHQRIHQFPKRHLLPSVQAVTFLE